ncbi:hypothetical protein G3496_04365 [Shewanella baltica]|jgi:hypothetical protein|uniref:hypothetical protein n=1 Tax=Shewanella baltica TaxID=62322 RepID=UPI00217DC073|nr:hypothetical protein [Shewanella baltica]MCS6134161.1 hypothetical protein [Shewanella baltica]
MTAIFPLQNDVTLHRSNSYPTSNAHAEEMGLTGTKNKEVRALTIAAFRVAQNNSQLSTVIMNRDLLLFLLANSDTALKYWIEKRRLIEVLGGYRLTPDGLTECQNTLLGLSGAYSTTEQKVQEWQERMVSGDRVACNPHQFSSAYWNVAPEFR